MGPSKLEYLELSFYRNSLKSMSDRSMYVNSILEMRLMGFVAIRFTLDGEHVSHSALRGVAENMDRQGGKEFHLTFQTAQSHDIVGSQISKREIISDQVADKISLSEIREYEGRSIFDKKDLEIEVDNGWPMFFATEAEKERRVQESQERRSYILRQWHAKNPGHTDLAGFRYYLFLSPSQKETLHREAAKELGQPEPDPPKVGNGGIMCRTSSAALWGQLQGSEEADLLTDIPFEDWDTGLDTPFDGHCAARTLWFITRSGLSYRTRPRITHV
ncbi:hypothetical protein NLI96_g12463 [Meripilus lineatus]|uniref:Uncharacterized protein n=1 Tax=Meripilus lineatus TaxID=2056292 RepID=A0AAD5URJ2_9APHY|nr:hypothetical protein NLI96_g12463 [Physisporinus lineatus]